MIALNNPPNGLVISVLTDRQLDFIKTDRSNIMVEDFDYLNLKVQSEEDYTFPQKICFNWSAKEAVELRISELPDFSEYKSVHAENSVEITNLKCATRYYWKVIGRESESEVFFFDTADAFPRFLEIPNLTNVRDCGGWTNTHGQKLRQGMIFRGSEMNSHVQITESGLLVMRADLKIKSVLDLRHEKEEVENVYGSNYLNVPVDGTYYRWFEHPERMLAIFQFLSDKENYPVYFHCWGGADRTGVLAFLLGALLGVAYEDLVDDYEITSLSVWGNRSRNTENRFKLFYDNLCKYDGASLEEKTENYMLSCGITKEQVGKFRKIMLMP